jgi:hypothetical protein
MRRLIYHWQVTGVVSALVGAYGYVPVREDATDEVKQAADAVYSRLLAPSHQHKDGLEDS